MPENLIEFGLIAADTVRTRAYLSALDKKGFMPRSTLILRSEGRNSKHYSSTSPSASDLFEENLDNKNQDWFNIDFEPGLELEKWFTDRDLEYEVLEDGDINSSRALRTLENRDLDMFVYSGFAGVIVSAKILKTEKKFLHVHPGLVPEYKGSTVFYYSLLDDKSLGASAIFLSQKIDEGEVIISRQFMVPKNLEVLDSVLDPAMRSRLLVEALEYLDSGGTGSKQTRVGRTFYVIHPTLKHAAILGQKVKAKGSEYDSNSGLPKDV